MGPTPTLPLTAFLGAFFGTQGLLALLVWLAPKTGWVDRPGGHKHHVGDVPVVGGLAVMLAVASLMAWVVPHSGRWITVLAGMAGLCLLGLVDDRWNLSARTRIVIQANVVALVLVLADVQLTNLGTLIPGIAELRLGWATLPFSVFCVVGVINAFNMVDGMDGLSASLFLIVAVSLLSLMPAAGPDPGLFALLGAAIVAMLAFLMWNWPLPWRIRRVFLGDAGTLPLGLLLGVLLVDTSQHRQALVPVAALWLFAWPLIDTVSVILRRLSVGRSAFSADQRHVHHLLLRAGFSVRQTWLIAILTQLALSAGGVLMMRSGVEDYWIACGFLTIAIVVHLGLTRAEQRSVLFGRPLRERIGTDHV